MYCTICKKENCTRTVEYLHQQNQMGIKGVSFSLCDDCWNASVDSLFNSLKNNVTKSDIDKIEEIENISRKGLK